MKCRRGHRRGLSTPGNVVHAAGKAPAPRWSGRTRKSEKGGIQASPESLPVWRSRGSPGPFPLAHARFDATIPPGSNHASPSGRFPAAGSDDSSCEVRAAWFSPGKDEACVERGSEVSLRRRSRRGNSGTGEWVGRGIHPALAQSASLGTLCPLAVGQSVGPSSAPGLVSSTGKLCHGCEPSQEMHCKFVQLSFHAP